MFDKFAINKTDAEVQLIDNTIKIPAKGWRGLTKNELGHVDVIYAIRKDWIKLEKIEPSTPETPEKPPLKTYTADSPEYTGEKEPRVKVTGFGNKK